MPETLRYYRLRVRNAADSADLLVVTSVRGGTNPYIADAPSGDGQSFTPLTGETSTGSYRLLVVDEGNIASAVTSILADANARQQLLSKRAFLESSADGSSWTGFAPGWVNGVRLVSPAKYEFAIGDSRREEVSTDVFKSVLLKRGPKTAAGMPGVPTFTRFPNCTMLIGGPVKTHFWGADDNGGWVVKVSQVVVSGAANTHYVQLKVQSYGWVDPRLGTGARPSEEFPSREFINHVNEETQAYFKPSTNWLGASSPIKGFFPDLYYRVETPARALVGFFTPIAEPRGSDVKRDDYITRQANSSSFWVAWEQSLQPLIDPITGAAAPGAGGTLAAPSVGTEYRLYLFATDISEKNPLHVDGHPLDIHARLFLDASIPYNAAAYSATRSAIGDELYIGLRITSSSKLDEVEQMLDGLFGTARRINNTGEREFYTTRIKDSAPPAQTITLADLRSYEGTGWEIDESTVSNRITLKQQRFGIWDFLDGSDPPPDGITVSPDTVIVDYGAATTPGDHETVYELPGRIINPSSGEDFIVGVAGEAFDRYGQGAIAGELHGLPSFSAPLGAEIILNLPHLPNAIAGRSPVSQRGGQRIVQIVQRTETPSGPDIRWVDAGTTVQAPAVPTFTLTLNAADPRKYADLVITNAVVLAAAGIKIRIETATGSGSPASGTLLTVLDPALQSTLTLPAVDAGTKVWVRMRSEIFGNRPSAWTAFTGLQLNVLNPVTGLAYSADAGLPSGTLSWVTGANAADIPVEVYSVTDTRTVVILPAGSTRHHLTGLTNGSRDFIVRHRETPPFNGVSADATITVVTAVGTPPTLPAPTSPSAFAGHRFRVPGRGFLTPIVDGSYGISLTAAVVPSSVEVQVAIGGGDFATVAIIPSEIDGRTRWSGSAPNDGQLRRMRARHVLIGWTPSDWTNEVSVDPWTFVAEVDPTDTEASLKNFRKDSEAADDTTVTYIWTRGAHVTEVWAAYQVFKVPVSGDPWGSVALAVAPLTPGVDSITVPKPADGYIMLLQVEPRLADLSTGTIRRVELTAAPQIPLETEDDIETDTVGTQWIKLVERGLLVTGVQFRTQVGSNPISAFGSATRSSGGASAVKGGTLGDLEYEHDIPLDPTRNSYIDALITLENGQTLALGPWAFDRDKNPNLLSVQPVGTVLTIIADSDTRSIKVANSSGSWIYEADGVSLIVDVAKTGTNGAAGLGTAASDTYTITARSDPTADVGGGTLTDSRNVVINGGTAPPASAIWDTPGVVASAPSMSSLSMQISLKATAAPGGWSFKVFIKLGSDAFVDHTADLSPTPGAPPTSTTIYSFDTEFVRIPPSETAVLRSYTIRADLLNGSGVVIDSRTVYASWYSTSAL